jgi:hypothetical protein
LPAGRSNSSPDLPVSSFPNAHPQIELLASGSLRVHLIALNTKTMEMSPVHNPHSAQLITGLPA